MNALTPQQQLRQTKWDDVSRKRRQERLAQSQGLTLAQTELVAAFAREHWLQLKSDAHMRSEYAVLCNAAGLDWLQLLADAARDQKDFEQHSHYLGVLAIRECRARQSENGGILQLGHLAQSLGVSPADAEAAIKSFGVLGTGIDIVMLPNGQRVIRSIPVELGSEQSQTLVACDALGYVTVDILRANLGWQRERCQWIIDSMVSAGLLWVDLQASPTQFWTPAVL